MVLSEEPLVLIAQLLDILKMELKLESDYQVEIEKLFQVHAEDKSELLPEVEEL